MRNYVVAGGDPSVCTGFSRLGQEMRETFGNAGKEGYVTSAERQEP